MLEALGVTATAAALYQAVLDQPGHGVDQLAASTGFTPTQIRQGLDELAELMLVRASSEHPGQMRAVTPDVGLADILRRQEAELAARQAQLAASRAAVTRMVAAHADSSRLTHGERLWGMDAIHARLETLARTATSECLGVHPGTDKRPEDLAAGRAADADAMKRGVTIKTLYQDATRNDPVVTTHAHWLLSNGGEVRTAPVLPQRLVIFDRTQALVPIDPADTRKGALHVAEPGLVNALVDLFEQSWATAVPLGAVRAQDPTTGLTDTERELLRLLGTGITDEAAAKRLGLSLRTVRRYMASIMERLNASSRFEAGIKATQMGWI